MKMWHAPLKLSEDIQHPKDTLLRVSEVAYLASIEYMDVAQAEVETYKSKRRLESRHKKTYDVSVVFTDVPEDFYKRLTGRRFTATFVAYAYTKMVKRIDNLQPEERSNYIKELEETFYEMKKAQQAQELIHSPAQSQPQDLSATLPQVPNFATTQQPQNYLYPQPANMFIPQQQPIYSQPWQLPPTKEMELPTIRKRVMSTQSNTKG